MAIKPWKAAGKPKRSWLQRLKRRWEKARLARLKRRMYSLRQEFSAEINGGDPEQNKPGRAHATKGIRHLEGANFRARITLGKIDGLNAKIDALTRELNK